MVNHVPHRRSILFLPTIGVLLCALSAPASPFILGPKRGLPPGRINAVAEMPDGVVAIGTRHGLLVWQHGKMHRYTGPWFNPRLGTYGKDVSGNSPLPGNEVHDLAVGSNGTLWIATDRGLARMRDGKIVDVTGQLAQAWRTGKFTPKNGRQPFGFKPWNDVQKLYWSTKTGLLVGTRGAGLFRRDRQHGGFQLIHGDGGINQWVETFAESKDGTLYVNIFGLGLFTYASGKLTRIADHGSAQAAPRDQARALCVDHQGSLWVGDSHGLRVRRGGKWTHYNGGTHGVLPGAFIGIVAADKKGRVWVRTDRGVAVFTKKGWRYPQVVDFGHNHRFRFWVTPNGDLWVSNARLLVRNPIIIWDQENPRTTRLKRIKQAVELDYPAVPIHLRAVADPQHRIWVATASGLLRYDGKTWTPVKALNKALGNEVSISDLFVDSKGDVWVGTPNAGAWRFGHGSVKHWNDDPGLSKSYVYDIAEGPKGSIYVGTQGGLYALTANGWEQLTHKYQVDPLAVDDHGRVWFGDINNGLIFYDHGKVKELSRGTPLAGFEIESITPAGDGQVRVQANRRHAGRIERRTFVCDGKTVKMAQPEKSNRQ